MQIYTLRGIEVEFPYDAYACQLDYMDRVIQALQEAPSRSAVNVAQSSPIGQQVQTWAEKIKEGYAELKAEGVFSLPTIVYSSRTHSQLAQVMKELRNTSYRSIMMAAIPCREGNTG
ncbi:hypothetical protein ABBQ32_013765 [Trebouxia sp. C0010 RCD-2024]